VIIEHKKKRKGKRKRKENGGKKANQPDRRAGPF
jgi:hypothetical protein